MLNPGPKEQDYQAAFAYQGAIAYVYLADRSTCPSPGMTCDWKRPPRYRQDVLPVARAFYNSNKTGKPGPPMKNTLDLIFARIPDSAEAKARRSTRSSTATGWCRFGNI